MKENESPDIEITYEWRPSQLNIYGRCEYEGKLYSEKDFVSKAERDFESKKRFKESRMIETITERVKERCYNGVWRAPQKYYVTDLGKAIILI